ncbi:hypothetical protein WA026_001122 [Henosepilachna vigintioctopunctata]|uniref:Uncharacterized protein n=1 Tax=Henosepilachna vigintioctopunctata TaxID=420089 RepID=A0AAW1V9I7_9CUCU
MTLSDTVSATASTATLPIIISFTSNPKTRKTQNIQDFLLRHPNCQKYIKKGPNFVADGVNEFRLYYVDSSLFDDGKLLKKLNVEKEEIVFGSTSCNSCHDNLPKESCISKDVSLNEKKHSQYTMIKNDKGVMCSDEYVMEGFWDNLKSSKIVGKVSKSFQVGSDLCLNVVFVNDADSEFFSSTQRNIFDPIIHTFDAKQTVSTSDVNMIKDRSSLIEDEFKDNVIFKNSSDTFKLGDSSTSKIGKHFNSCQSEQMHITQSNNLESKVIEKINNQKLSQNNLEFSIRSSPSFLANYVFKILKDKNYDQNFEIPGISVVNYVEKKGIKNYEYFKNICKAMSDDSIQHSRILGKTSFKGKSKYPILKYKDFKPNDKMNRYYQKDSTCYKLECIFKYNGDSFLRKSHYAILKKYHRNLKKVRNKRRSNCYRCKNENVLCEVKRFENIECKKCDNNKKSRTDEINVNELSEVTKMRELSLGDSKTTISEFLHSYQPCQWKTNSKLSVCIDEECMTE